MQKKWTESEDQILKLEYPKNGYRGVQKFLNRSKQSISARAWLLGIKTKNYKMNAQLFEVIKDIMKLGEKTVSEIADDLKISRHCIYEYFKRRKLKITDFYTSDKQLPRLPKKNQGIVYVYKSYKNGAIARNLNFELNLEQLQNITSSNCAYCDSAPAMVVPRKTYTYVYNGIDRKNNTEGYTVSNSLPCCNLCNFMKYTHTEEEFLNQIEKIYKFRINK